VTRTERALARRWRSLLVPCLLVALTGAVLVIWARIDAAERRADAADRRADRITAEAARRGEAVTTLAGDVRVLRAQVQARGEKPKAPDPGRAVEDLPDRQRVPVPIPGQKGEKGDKGEPGEPAPTITPRPGASGKPGRQGEPGADSTVPGPSGPPGKPGQDATGAPGRDGADGKDGRDGADGRDGEDGKPPAGWTWTDRFGDTYTCQPADDFDPNAPHYQCTSDRPPPEPEPGPSVPLALALDPNRRQW
jgi:hypothetical protein